MANKSFVIQYLIKAREKYVAVAEKVRKSSKGMQKSIDKAAKSSAALAVKSSVLKNKIKSVTPSMALARTEGSRLDETLRGVKKRFDRVDTLALQREMRALRLPMTLVNTRGLRLTRMLSGLKKRFALSTSKFKSGLRSALAPMQALNAAVTRLKLKLQGIEKRFEGLSGIGTKMRNTGIAMAALVTLPIGLAAVALKNAASDAEETRSKFATVFKDIGPRAEGMADKLAAGFGLAGTQARQLLADTGDLLSGFGFTQDSALKLSNRVNELAVDLASFGNFSGGAEGASAALTKALLGERESVKALGIAILEKDVQAKVRLLLSQGQTFASERQAKAEATLVIAIEQSKNAIGDFAATQHQLANQERITSARLIDLKESFGRVLLPVTLKANKIFRRIFVALTALSPAVKKVILIFGAIVAALGPLLLIVGTLLLLLPALSAGFSIVGVLALPALGSIALIAGVVAATAFVIIRNWDRVKAFFKGFAEGIKETFGPTVMRLIEDFKEAAGIIAELFSSDSEAARNLFEFSNLGEFVGKVIGELFDLLVRGFSGMGAIIGQFIAAVTTLDFGQFDIESIKAEFLGAQAQPLLTQTRVDVGVNVGLDKGLTQTSVADVVGNGLRRVDVGLATP